MAVFTNSRKWVYPLKIGGEFSRYHRISSTVLFFILAVVPWLRWGDRPLLLIDVPARQLHVLGMMFVASDGIFIMLGALFAAFSLFFFTAMFGRLWCGYACPQSVFMLNVVIPIEELLEGSRSERIARDKAGPTTNATLRKGVKFILYGFVAWIISMCFMGFFVPAADLWTFQASGTTYAIVAFFTFLWFWDFAWYREQTCNYICPYARFQSALTDRHSWLISYDTSRGEPRGKAAKSRGGCIDCMKCVNVCPQGIDIRNGFQLECIACGKCIDACDSVMGKLGHPSLVRYSTESKDTGGVSSLIRTRTVAYAAILTAITAGIVVNLGNNKPLELLVDRAPGSLFIVDADGFVRNTWFVRVADKSLADGKQTYDIAVDGLPEGSEVNTQPVQLSAAERTMVPLIVRVPTAQAQNTMPIRVTVHGGDISVTEHTTFKGPGATTVPSEGTGEKP